MLSVLEFIFSSFWIWLGTLILLVAFGGALSGSVKIVTRG
jgi:hypothetical protein